MANGRVREYIGARYVPIFADPVTWDNERAYDPLTMVQYSGETYMSKQFVPIGAPLPTVSQGEESNEFWVHMSNWNAQVEAYREEVMRYAAEVLEFDGRIDTLENELPTSEFDSTNTVKKYVDDNIDTIENVLPASAFDSTNTVKKYVDDNIDTIENVLPASAFDSTNTVKKYVDDSISSVTANGSKMLTFGDSWIAHVSQIVVNGCWCNYVAERLGLTIKNYGKAGAKLATQLANADSFYSQVQQAINEIPSNERDDYKYAFIMGGVNDYHTANVSPADFQADIIYALDLFNSAFPKTTAILIPMNMFFEQVGNTSRYKEMCWAAMMASIGRAVYMGGLAPFFRSFGQSVYRPNDDSDYSAGGGTYHPNNKGNRYIASWILANMLGGGSSHWTWPVNLTMLDTTNFELAYNNTTTDGKYVYWDLKFTVKNGLAAGFHNFAIGMWDSYPIILSDRNGDSSGNEIAPALTPIGDSNVSINTFQCSMFVKDFNTSATLRFFNQANVTNNFIVSFQGTTKIMDAW